jgi:SpoVK/Ycf46/Vps4 family AAA+-type ATPase
MIDTKNFKPLKITGDRKVDVFSRVDGLSLQSVFFAEFDNIFPNLYTYRTDEAHMSYTFDTKQIMEELGRVYGDSLQLVVYTVYNIQTKKEEVGLNFVLPEKKIVGRIETSPAESYLEYTHGGEEEVGKLTEIFLRHFRKPDLPPNNVYTVAYENGYFLNKLPTKDFSGLDVAKNYNDDLVKESNKIENFIKSDDSSGLLILHGEKGTGKSTYIRHLISTNPEKKFVYVPSSMVSILGQPNFSTFLMTLQNHVIILEDCEDAIKDRKSNGTPAAVSLLLNLTDGLLSDGLGLKFICTFNDDVKNIDTALLRKGRLVSKYEFKLLTADKANALLEELYLEGYENGDYSIYPNTTSPMSLANIYNFYEDSYEKERKKII